MSCVASLLPSRLTIPPSTTAALMESFLFWCLVCRTPCPDWSCGTLTDRCPEKPSSEQFIILRTGWPLTGFKSESTEFFLVGLSPSALRSSWISECFQMFYVTPSGSEKFVVADTSATSSPGLKNSNGGHKLFYISSEWRQLCAGAASEGVGPPLRLIFPLKVNHSTQSLCVSVKERINQHISLLWH